MVSHAPHMALTRMLVMKRKFLLKNLCLQVIFVDADQIVRTDMGELYDMDIKGKPLAYTPFCDNNREMDGYRFWRQVKASAELQFIYIICISGHCT